MILRRAKNLPEHSQDPRSLSPIAPRSRRYDCGTVREFNSLQSSRDLGPRRADTASKRRICVVPIGGGHRGTEAKCLIGAIAHRVRLSLLQLRLQRRCPRPCSLNDSSAQLMAVASTASTNEFSFGASVKQTSVRNRALIIHPLDGRQAPGSRLTEQFSKAGKACMNQCTEHGDMG